MQPRLSKSANLQVPFEYCVILTIAVCVNRNEIDSVRLTWCGKEVTLRDESCPVLHSSD